MQLATDIESNNRAFYEYVRSKREMKGSGEHFLNAEGNLVTGNVEKAEVFK